MCLGFPMTVLSGDGEQAVCQRKGERETVSMLLVGAQTPGTHVLVHLGSAVRVLQEDEAKMIDDALEGLATAMQGGDFEIYFADLIDREPELPAFLRESK